LRLVGLRAVGQRAKRKEIVMKKFLILMMILGFVACRKQTVHHTSTYLDGHSFQEVWDASIQAVYDIDFTVDSVDRATGFISAECGPLIMQEIPPRLTVLISRNRGRVFVECRMLQKDQFIDVFGHGKRTIRRFFAALNMHLNQRPHQR
jgi:hypothetical protein